MKDHIIFKILNHLYERDAISDDFIDITDFLKTIWDETNQTEQYNNLFRIESAKTRIFNAGYATFRTNPTNRFLTAPVPGDFSVTPVTANLNNTAIQAQISVKGYDYIVEELRKRRQDELNDNIIATNSSLQEVNKSTRDLNTQTKEYYGQLEIATWVIAIATLLNIGATLVPYIFKKPEKSILTSPAPALIKKDSTAQNNPAGQPRSQH